MRKARDKLHVRIRGELRRILSDSAMGTRIVYFRTSFSPHRVKISPPAIVGLKKAQLVYYSQGKKVRQVNCFVVETKRLLGLKRGSGQRCHWSTRGSHVSYRVLRSSLVERTEADVDRSSNSHISGNTPSCRETRVRYGAVFFLSTHNSLVFCDGIYYVSHARSLKNHIGTHQANPSI
jgi:hypothetical protein